MRAYYILCQLFRRQGQTRFALFQRGATDPNPPRQAQVLERAADTATDTATATKSVDIREHTRM